LLKFVVNAIFKQTTDILKNKKVANSFLTFMKDAKFDVFVKSF